MIDPQKISERQLTRMLYLEGFGLAGLTFPAAAVWAGKGEGGSAVICYGIFLILFVAYLLWVSQDAKPEGKKKNAFVMPGWAAVVYMIRYAVNAAAIFLFFGLSMQHIYMPDHSRLHILLPFAIVVWYCAQTTLQKRGRFLELLFPWITGVFFLMLILAAGNLFKNDGWAAIRPSGIMPKTSVVEAVHGGGLLLLLASPLEFLVFLAPSLTGNLWGEEREVVTGREKWTAVFRAAAGILLWEALLWFVTVKSLGRTITAATPWPVIKIMQRIRWEGGFLERFDLLLALYWIFCLLSVLSGYLYYGRKIGEDSLKTKRGKRCWWTVGTALLTGILWLAAGLVKEPEQWLSWYVEYKKWVDLPLLLFLPLLIKKGSGSKRKKKKVATWLLCLLPGCLFLHGCGRQVDVEKREYVLSVYVETNENGYEFQAATANLSDTEERESQIPCQVRSFEGKTMDDIEEQMGKSADGEMEWNHVFTIFLGPELMESEEKLYGFLVWWEDSWQKSPDAMLSVCTASPESLYSISKIPEGSAGQVASEMAEQQEKRKKTSVCHTAIDALKKMYAGEEKLIFWRTFVRDEMLELQLQEYPVHLPDE